MVKSRAGFVLAEVLVVSVIVAILAAVAVPLYTGYLRSQRQENVKNLAQAAAIAANAYYRRHDDLPDSAKLGLFLPDPTKYQIGFNHSISTVIVTDATDGTITSSVVYK